MFKKFLDFSRSLRIKFIIWVAIVSIATMIAGMALIVSVTRDAQQKALLSKASSIALFVSKLVIDPILYKDVLKIDAIVSDACKDDDVLFVFVNDENGHLLNTPLEGIDNEDEEINSMFGDLMSSNSDEIVKQLLASKNILNVNVPVRFSDNNLGSVTVGVTKNKLKKLILKTMAVMSLIVILVMVAQSIALFFLFNSLVFKRFSFIYAATNTLASGDLTARIEIKTDDEIGGLASAINKLAENLNHIIKGTKEVVLKVSTISQQVTEYFKGMLEDVKKQRKSLNDTGISIEAIDKTISEVAQGADNFAVISENASLGITELASSIKEVADNVNQLSNQAADAASSVEEFVASIKEISDSLENVSASTEDTTSAVTQINTVVIEVEKAAEESAILAEKVTNEAGSKGIVAGQEAVKGIVTIMETVKGLHDVIGILGKKSDEIGKIINVIDDISDQTSLLALNASILAAQSGEHGKGFSVVAEEIKALAVKTRQSTKEIVELVNTVQEDTKKSVEMVAVGMKKVEEGTNLVKKVNEALQIIKQSSEVSTEKSKLIQRAAAEQTMAIKQITHTITEITEQIEHIAKATTEQSKGSRLIKESVERINELSQQIKKTTGEQREVSNHIKTLVENVSQQAETLKKTTDLQKDSSRNIVESVNEIENVSEENVKRAFQMAETIKELETVTRDLLNEIEKFRVS